MNTVSFTPQPDGQVRVTIHSEGEHDQSALISATDFKAAFDARAMSDTQVVTQGEDTPGES